MSANFLQSVFYIIICSSVFYLVYMYTKIFALMAGNNAILKSAIYISLDEEDFRCILGGGALKIAYMRAGKSHVVNIVLKDIGFARMDQCIQDALTQSIPRLINYKIIED